MFSCVESLLQRLGWYPAVGFPGCVSDVGGEQRRALRSQAGTQRVEDDERLKRMRAVLDGGESAVRLRAAIHVHRRVSGADADPSALRRCAF